MSMNDTPVSERIHIAFFGCRNAGKSSLLNAVTGQQMAVVSSVKGTTTDPVYKTMELLPAGPVVIIDTPGLDDEGELGSQRIDKALGVLKGTDVAVVVIDAKQGKNENDEKIIGLIKKAQIPFIEVYNKSDLLAESEKIEGLFYASALKSENINALKEKIAALAKKSESDKPIASDLVNAGDYVALVIPIDKAAPKGRLILPQQQVIRDLLDKGAIPITVRDSELEKLLDDFENKIALVITDSQVFGKIKDIVPENIPLTSFSILFSRYKGELSKQLEGLEALKNLKENDKVLVAEGCTHHRQCGDIGTVKIPAAVKKICGFDVTINTVSGKEFPSDLSQYKAVIHCGGCMLGEREMKARIAASSFQNIPITNYGMVLAMASGQVERSIAVFDLEK